MDKHFDVIIVGSGAGGGTLARCLAPSGKNILILERADWLKREAVNWDAATVFESNRYVSPDTWYDSNGRLFQPQVHYFVGGATKMFGAALFRQRREDFGELRHHDGISPAWPISYDELEPYYTRGEEMYYVHGLRGQHPTEPPASAPYPRPPISDEPRILRLRDNLLAAGYHPFPAPEAIMLDEANMAYSRCIRCQTCDGFPCLVHAKADAEIAAVRPALDFANVTLMRNAKALKLETNAAGTVVTQVIADLAGEQESFRGDIVVVSCGAANSAKLLLMSANDKHPNGLANRRSGATTCFTTAKPHLRSHSNPIRPFIRKPLRSMTSISEWRDSSTPWAISRCLASRPDPCIGEKSRSKRPCSQ